MTNKEKVQESLNLLNEPTNKQTWIGAFASHANEICKNIDKVKKAREAFHRFGELWVYSGISDIKNKNQPNRFNFKLRVFGQNVANIDVDVDDEKGEVKVKKVKLSSTKYQKANKDFFNIDDVVEGEWHSPEAVSFRKSFKKVGDNWSVKSPEHKIENYLLREFSKRTRNEGKKLCNIQPVTLCPNTFFQMNTPFMASKTPLEFNDKAVGGGIDILARIKTKNDGNCLCVFELKDENKASEPQEKVIQQGLAYATFLAKLLSTKEAEADKWWHLFGFNYKGKVPEKFHIYVASLLPKKAGVTDIIDGKEVIDIEGKVFLHVHSLFFDENTFEFSGTLKDQLLNEGK